MRLLSAAMLGTAITALPLAANADELNELKRELAVATKAIEALQQRVKTLEAQKARNASASAAEPAAAVPVKAAPTAPVPLAAPVVAPNEHLTVAIPGVRNGRLEIYGAAQLDAIYDAKRVDPNWEATLRPSKIPVNCPPVGFDPGCGKNGTTTFSVRQTTFGVKGFLPTEYGEMKTQFEFDLFGSNTDAGKTAFRLKQAWGSIGPFLAGQTYTLFMDPDVFPNTIDFWGPSGLMFIYDPQLRWTAFEHEGVKFTLGLEVPGAAVDIGKVADQIPELANVREHIKYPDITGQFRVDQDWGHAQVAGVARWVSFDNPTGINGDPANTLFGWGVSGSAVVKTIGKDTINGQVTYGQAIAAYSNDCCFDLGPNGNLRAQTLPLFNWMAYYNHWWTDKWSSAIGYSQNQQDNSAGQLDAEQHRGSYASVNLLYYPMQNLMMGVEGLWGERVNKDGAKGNDQRVQFSTRFTF
jgi:hypothetical protein